jgi:hypothetical protein
LIVTKSVTTRRARETREIALYFSSVSSTPLLDGRNHSKTWAGCIVAQFIIHLLNLCSTASRLLSHHSALNVTPTSRYAVGS